MYVIVLLGSSPLLDICGILVGHIYYFLQDIVPRVYNKHILYCPQFLYNMFNEAQVRNDWRSRGGHRLN